MGKIKGFLFAVRHREILMTDLGLSNKTPCKCKSINNQCFCIYRAHCLLSILPFKTVAMDSMCFCPFVACCFDL